MLPYFRPGKVEQYLFKCVRTSIGKGVLFKTFHVKVQVHSVPEL